MKHPNEPIPEHLNAMLALVKEVQDQNARQFFQTHKVVLLSGGSFLAQLGVYCASPSYEAQLLVLFLSLLSVMLALHQILECQAKRRLRLFHDVIRELWHRSEC